MLQGKLKGYKDLPTTEVSAACASAAAHSQSANACCDVLRTWVQTSCA